jgi:hypothetical protein|tara:strand:+ start:3702 stop:4004 length:303 start_codon:yes stop_codon:yes gene_type:complete
MDKKKNFIYNAMYLEYLHETTTTIVRAKFGNKTFLDETNWDKGMTDNALAYYSDVHEEVEGMVNQMLNTYSDEELWKERRKEALQEIETLTIEETKNELN